MEDIQNGTRDECGNTFFKDLKCVICLSERENVWLDINGASHFKCYTCEGGYVCGKCIPDFDPRGSIFCDDLDDVRDTIKCPCCRQENWKYHFNQIIQVTLEYDIVDMYFGMEDNKAIAYYIRQQTQKEEEE